MWIKSLYRVWWKSNMVRCWRKLDYAKDILWFLLFNSCIIPRREEKACSATIRSSIYIYSHLPEALFVGITYIFTILSWFFCFSIDIYYIPKKLLITSLITFTKYIKPNFNLFFSFISLMNLDGDVDYYQLIRESANIGCFRHVVFPMSYALWKVDVYYICSLHSINNSLSVFFLWWESKK